MDGDGKHKRFVYDSLTDSKADIFTMTSCGRSGQEISAKLFGKMARQRKSDKNTLAGLVNCDVSHEDCEATPVQNGDLSDGNAPEQCGATP